MPGKSRAGAGITLGLLIKEGILWPGEDVLTVEYKSVMTHATLTPDGQITCKVLPCGLHTCRSAQQSQNVVP